MKTYESNETFFEAFEALVKRIADSGEDDVASRLRERFSRLNGLTDGWALLMESIEQTVSQDKDKLSPEDVCELESMLTAVRKTVYRR